MKTSTWNAKAATGDWNTAENWDPAAVPSSTANFTTSSQTAITFSKNSDATINNIEFAAGAPSYIFNFNYPAAENTPALSITGKGVSNNSANPQHFVVASSAHSYSYAQIRFSKSSSAGGSRMFYSAGPTTPDSAGGGVIRFVDESTAGSANFSVTTGAKTPPKKNSTVGAEVSFGDTSSAGSACFTIYGSTSLSDGDTFGNTVFHDSSTADNAIFTNIGGTVPGGDGGNTQLYDTSTAANGVFHNLGGTAYGIQNDKKKGANGGDVAFDVIANGANGHFHNYVATVAGANGGVTSFNNNPPNVEVKSGKPGGASAGSGYYSNYGAQNGNHGGGGHTKFTALWGSPTAANGTFHNYGSDTSNKTNASCAGNTVFSVTTGIPTKKGKYGCGGNRYFPTAGNAQFHNHPAMTANGDAGFTKFAMYPPYTGKSARDPIVKVPTAGSGIFNNYGGNVSNAKGGYTEFSNTTDAGNAQLIASGGTNGGYGGRIIFYDQSSGESASVQLFGNGELIIGDHTNGLTLKTLELTDGIISTQLGTNVTSLTLSGELVLKSKRTTFSFWNKDGGGFEFNTPYTVLSSPSLTGFTADQFTGNKLEGVEPTFAIAGKSLQVSFNQ